MQDSPPSASVIILNHNAKHALDSCISSVLASSYPNFEIIVVDNGSTDGSVELVKDRFQQLKNARLIQSNQNLGASAGRNSAVKHAKGRYLAFLDPDTQVDGNWLREAIVLMEQRPSVAIVQCKLFLSSDKKRIDYVGDFLSQFGFLVQRAPLGAFDNNLWQKTALIFGVKSAGMVANRETFERIGMFDEDYFIYMEETDLCWRAWLNGYQVAYSPSSLVYHDFGQLSKLKLQRTRFLSKYHGTKNYITTILKNADGSSLLKILPIHIALWIGIAVWHFGRRRTQEGFWISSGIIYNLRNLRATWRKRVVVQRRVRRVPDKTILPQVMVRVSPTYLYQKATQEGSGWRI